MLKKILLAIAVFMLSFIAFVLLYFDAAHCLSRITINGDKSVQSQIAIYIKTNGAHTDIVMPVRSEVIDWSEMLPFKNTISKDTTYTYLSVGWGDKGFYLDTPTWGDLKFSTAFRAAFWLSTTAMHATYCHDMKEGSDCRRIMISCEQYARLVDFVTAGFQRDITGNFILIPTDAVYSDDDAFYEGRGRYNLFYTCNTWTNCALRAARQRHCVWTIFDRGIFLAYPEH